MTDPASIAPTRRPTQPRRVRRRLRGGRGRGRATRTWATRLFDRDATLWSSDERVQAAIAERLGWLDAPVHFANSTAGLEGFGDAVVEEGFTTRSWPGWAAAASRPTSCTGRSGAQEGYLEPAHPRLDRSGLRRGDARRPRPAPDA